MKKKLLAMVLAMSVACSLAACGQQKDTSKSDTEKTENAESTGSTEGDKERTADSSDQKTNSETSEEVEKKEDAASQESQQNQQTKEQKTEIQAFIDSDLEYAMKQLAANYESAHPDVEVIYNVDSSVSLMPQIQAGIPCDLYFSGTESQMENLRNSGWIISDAYTNVVGDNLIVIGKKGSTSTVTSLDNIADAGSIALAKGSLSLGVYTRRAMVVSGLIIETDDLSAITVAEISDQLNGTTIQEKDSGAQIISAVTDGSCEVGCVLYSDICGYEDKLDVLQTLGNDYSGRIVYSLAQIKNEKASQEESAAAVAFMEYIKSQEAATVFSQCHFWTVQ